MNATNSVKHTEGPWEINSHTKETGYNDGYLNGNPNHPAISIEIGKLREQMIFVMGNGAGESIHDARLISAAPELLKACKELLATVYDILPEVSEGLSELLADANHAIAKAEGR